MLTEGLGCAVLGFRTVNETGTRISEDTTGTRISEVIATVRVGFRAVKETAVQQYLTFPHTKRVGK
eukprot:3938377-Rhodomonas_salina.8